MDIDQLAERVSALEAARATAEATTAKLADLGTLANRVSMLETARTDPESSSAKAADLERLVERVGALERADATRAAAKSAEQWDLSQFNQGEADLRWAKEQTTAVARNSAVLSGAILAASKLVALDQRFFFWIVVAQAAIAIYWEIRLHVFAREARARVNSLLSSVGRGVEPKALDNHLILAVALCGLVAGAAVLAIAAPLLPGANH